MDDYELDYDVITIDSSVLKNEGYKFDEGLLNQLTQFKDSPVKVVQSDVVHNEGKMHIAESIRSARGEIHKALRSVAKQLKVDEPRVNAAKELLDIPGTEADIAEDRLKAFYDRIGAEVVKSEDYIDFSRLMDMYFKVEAPFEAGRDKRAEFPDAIALLSLEKWAEENGFKMIAVSSDNGWKNYSLSSSVIKVVGSLSEAISLFQPHNQVNLIVARIQTDALFDANNYVFKAIEHKLIGSIDAAVISVEADSFLIWEEDEVYATYRDHDLVTDKNGVVAVRVVRIQSDLIVIEVSSEVDCEVTASFNFSIYDSIDKDYVYMGGLTTSKEETYFTDILITLTGDFSKGFEGLEVSNVEVLETISLVDFGTIGPDYSDHED